MGIDIKSLIMGVLGGKLATDNAPVVVVQNEKLPEVPQMPECTDQTEA